MIRITLANEGDVGAITEVSNWAARETTANFATVDEPVEGFLAEWRTSHRMHAWFVAKDGDAVVGFARSSVHKPRGAYAWSVNVSVYILPSHHGQGVGTKLYGALIPVMRAQGYETAMAGITDGNTGSEALHAKVGFRRCGTFHRIGWKQGTWLDVGYWELALQSGNAEPRAIRAVSEVLETPG